MASTPVKTTAAGPFGVRLRQWRQVRGLSQLGLASAAGTTPRHLSFLETGRSRPSRDMVLRLTDVLGVSLREGNQLLQAAGLAPAYPEAGVEAAELEPFRRAIDRLLAAHEPFPALVVDAHANVIAANRASSTLFAADLVGANMVQRYLTDTAIREAIVNRSEVAWAALARLRTQLRQAPLDDELRALVGLAEATVAGLPPPRETEHGLVVCPWFRVGDTVVRTIVMAARFDAAVAVTLDELRVELIYPQDPAAERFFREQAH
jgi:transcriptional regulator with XRE-family HTH domain